MVHHCAQPMRSCCGCSTNSRHHTHGMRGSEVCGRSRACSSWDTALRAFAAAAAVANAMLALDCTGAAKGRHVCRSAARHHERYRAVPMGRPRYYEIWYNGVPLFGVPEKGLVPAAGKRDPSTFNSFIRNPDELRA
eukprot:3288450-Rhodomonas_salina.2